MPLKKQLLLVRHAQSQANSEGRVQGWMDSPLSEHGHFQARRLANRLAAEFEADKIFASPLKRAAETAAYIQQATACPVHFNKHLKERNLGALTGLTKQEIRDRFPEMERAWANNLPRPPIEGMETDAEFALRVQLATEAVLRDTEPGTTAIVVSHGGALNQMLKNWLRLEKTGSSTFTFHNASLTIVDVRDTYVKLVLLNGLAHLGVDNVKRPPNYLTRHHPR
ncbi:MAG TPA: histidine phosphatase family protein [Anaerolineae bacterium]|nr:histidine phosphatase family protein [Anaerolineae bacterium]